MSTSFLTIAQAADQVGVSRQAVWRKCKAGIIPSSIDQRTGKTVIQVVDLIAHYGELQQPTTPSNTTERTIHNTKQHPQSNTATVVQHELEWLRRELEEKKKEIEELKRAVKEERAHALEETSWLKQLIDRQALLLQASNLDEKATKTKKPKRDKTGRPS